MKKLLLWVFLILFLFPLSSNAQSISVEDYPCWSELYLSLNGTANGRNKYTGITGSSAPVEIKWLGGKWLLRFTDGGTMWTTITNSSPNPPSSAMATANGTPWELAPYGIGIGCGMSPVLIEGSGTVTTILLPVELIDFNVLLKADLATLIWHTASEVNNLGFEVERSINGTDWETIGFVEGSGESFSIQAYDFVDRKPVLGLSYYRLKQMDFDGKFEYSEVISTEVVRAKALTLFPNPVEDKVSILGFKEGKVTLFNNAGQIVKAMNLTDNELDISSLPSGIYFLRIEEQNEVSVKRLIKN